MGARTALYPQHLKASGKIVDFGGWDMPLHYGSQVEEHHVVRQSAGMFDVSHMTVVDVSGAQAQQYLRYLLANDVARLQEEGKALYSAMLNEQGGVLDDLIVYRMAAGAYRVVVNCATREKDLAWMQQVISGFDATLQERPDLAMIAIQGPQARAKVQGVCPQAAALIESLKVFSDQVFGDWMFCRTGYTGEDGLEVMLPEVEAGAFWEALLAAGVQPCGLGARDTLRLEAGMNLYGSDMNEGVSPLVSNMAWTVVLNDRDFIGKTALQQEQAQGPAQQLVGLVLEGKGVLRAHYKVRVPGLGEGEITSGTFSPTLGVSIALARIPAGDAAQCEVEIRNRLLPARIVKPCFVRHGQSCIA